MFGHIAVIIIFGAAAAAAIWYLVKVERIYRRSFFDARSDLLFVGDILKHPRLDKRWKILSIERDHLQVLNEMGQKMIMKDTRQFHKVHRSSFKVSLSKLRGCLMPFDEDDKPRDPKHNRKIHVVEWFDSIGNWYPFASPQLDTPEGIRAANDEKNH